MGYKGNMVCVINDCVQGFSSQLWDIKNVYTYIDLVIIKGFSSQLWDIKLAMVFTKNKIYNVLAPNYGI